VQCSLLADIDDVTVSPAGLQRAKRNAPGISFRSHVSRKTFSGALRSYSVGAVSDSNAKDTAVPSERLQIPTGDRVLGLESLIREPRLITGCEDFDIT